MPSNRGELPVVPSEPKEASLTHFGKRDASPLSPLFRKVEPEFLDELCVPIFPCPHFSQMP